MKTRTTNAVVNGANQLWGILVLLLGVAPPSQSQRVAFFLHARLSTAFFEICGRPGAALGLTNRPSLDDPPHRPQLQPAGHSNWEPEFIYSPYRAFLFSLSSSRHESPPSLSQLSRLVHQNHHTTPLDYIPNTTAATVQPPTMADRDKIQILKDALYDAAREHGSDQRLFTQRDLLDMQVIPQDNMTLLIQVIQILCDEKLFVGNTTGSGLSWRWRSREDAKKYVWKTTPPALK